MRGYARRHTDGNSVRAVYQKIGITCRQYGGLHSRVVEVGIKINRLFVDIPYHFGGNLAHSRFRITVSGRRVSVHRTEVSVSVNERTADRKVLRKPDEGVVNGAVAVGVIFTQNVADDKRTLTVRSVRGEVQFVHRIEYTAVNGFKSVPDVRDSSRYVDRHGVCDKRLFELAVDLDGFDRRFG